jgi:DNA transposition AAA+ family ATPase
MMEEKKQDENFSISGDTVKTNLAEMIRARKITQDQADLIWWFYSFSRANDWTLKQAAGELGVDGSTLWRVLKNEYGAKIDNFCEKIARQKIRLVEQATITNVTFVETKTAREIFKVCDAALFSQTIAFIFGDSQQGKTMALEEYARRHNHGQTKYIRLPASAGVQLVAKEIAKACYVSHKSCFEHLRDRIMRAIDKKNLIIIDELHQCFSSYNKTSTIKVLEFIREIYDRTKCGMVLCGTHVLKEEMERGKLSLMAEQLRRRGIIQINLPNNPPKSDIDKIANSFRLESPANGSNEYDIIKSMLQHSGLGMYVKLLQAASSMAKKEDKPIEWSHVIRTHDILARRSF